MYLANHRDVPGCWDTLRRAEKVAMWHIETADAVEFSDEHWEVLNVYRCRPRARASPGPADDDADAAADTYRSLAGYMTLYTFLNPFKGAKVRVCQVLVLPHEQKKGLGREMLLAVYRLAAGRPDVAEVTVEDPCPGFQAMRDTVDCEWLAAAMPAGLLAGHDGVEEWVTATSPQARADHAARLKITPSQAHFAFEAMKYALLHRRLAAAEAAADATGVCAEAEADAPAAAAAEAAVDSCEADLKAFRLAVKRRLLGENPHLKAAGKEAMQKELDALYAEMVERYQKCEKHCLRAVAARIGEVGP
jgi:GNAT superfamily N-acetyltransferase